jgi:hypothetical protein
MVFFGLACAVGALIGLSWSVFALLPVTAVMALIWGALSLGQGDFHPSSLLIAAIGLQGGYVIGLTGRDLFGAVISRLQTAPPKRF